MVASLAKWTGVSIFSPGWRDHTLSTILRVRPASPVGMGNGHLQLFLLELSAYISVAPGTRQTAAMMISTQPLATLRRSLPRYLLWNVRPPLQYHGVSIKHRVLSAHVCSGTWRRARLWFLGAGGVSSAAYIGILQHMVFGARGRWWIRRSRAAGSCWMKNKSALMDAPYLTSGAVSVPLL